MLRRFALAVVCGLSVAAIVGAPASSKTRTLQDALDAGWDCTPVIQIVGYYHCAPPGKSSIADLFAGGVTAPSIVLQAYRPSGPMPGTAVFAGIEVLIRADLFRNHVPKCPQNGLETWTLLDFTPADYYACHRFDA